MRSISALSFSTSQNNRVAIPLLVENYRADVATGFR